jgi:hypothetical protein
MNGQLRLGVILPIVLFAILATGIALFTLTRGQESSNASNDAVISSLPRPTHTPAAPARKSVPTTPPQATRSAKPPKPARPAKARVKLNAGLPPALARALTSRRIAVVSLVTPGSELDEMAAKEAAAGAAATGAAFVRIDVAREREARPLAVMLGVLEAPTVLVFKRPGELFVRLDGFADLDTVAQAAENATP